MHDFHSNVLFQNYEMSISLIFLYICIHMNFTILPSKDKFEFMFIIRLQLCRQKKFKFVQREVGLHSCFSCCKLNDLYK